MGLKGFALTVDVLLAIGIASIIILALSQVPKQDHFLYLERVANDILLVLDKDGTLDTLNASLITQGLRQFLGTTLVAKLEIKVYNYQDGNFVLNETIVLVEPDASLGKDVHRADRLFVKFENNEVEKYSFATLLVGSR
ncbi:MAG: hypothetical protein QMD12_01625 [Candidatus Aenigmarchaeota archaeon]|nr:hypothetical protein [Candidatus Aenigmarchaeota archaeon]